MRHNPYNSGFPFRKAYNFEESIVKLNQIIPQLSIQVPSENLVLPQDGGSAPLTWSPNFLNTLTQLNWSQQNIMQNETQILATVVDNDPQNKILLEAFGYVLVDPRISLQQSATIDEIYKRQCVALIQRTGTTNDLSTYHWWKGPDALSLSETWAIATFNGAGKTYNDSLVKHAGIFVGSTPDGFYMISQNMNGTASNAVGGIDIRKFFTSFTGNTSANASKYYLLTV